MEQGHRVPGGRDKATPSMGKGRTAWQRRKHSEKDSCSWWSKQISLSRRNYMSEKAELEAMGWAKKGGILCTLKYSVHRPGNMCVLNCGLGVTQFGLQNTPDANVLKKQPLITRFKSVSGPSSPLPSIPCPFLLFCFPL